MFSQTKDVKDDQSPSVCGCTLKLFVIVSGEQSKEASSGSSRSVTAGHVTDVTPPPVNHLTAVML